MSLLQSLRQQRRDAVACSGWFSKVAMSARHDCSLTLALAQSGPRVGRRRDLTKPSSWSKGLRCMLLQT